MPIPPIILIAIAPDLGNLSDATANIVGQKNVLPKAYTLKAIMAPVKAVAVLTKFNPIHAKTAQTKRRVTGLRLRVFSIQ